MDTFISAMVLLTGLTGCVTDLNTRRIPNVLTIGSAAVALVFHAFTGGASGAFASGAGCLTAAGLFFIPFALGGLGAGDVKLLAALGAWVGPEHALWLAGYTAIAGGALAIVVALAHGYLRQAIGNIWLLLVHWSINGIRPLAEVSLDSSTSPRLAYGVAIFFGTVGTLWFR